MRIASAHWSPFHRAFLPLVLGLLSPISSAFAQKTVTAATPDVVAPDPFSDVSGVFELPDGRLVVLDRRESAVFVVDFPAQTRRQIGRAGDGPGEYRLPWTLLPLMGDSVAIYDRANLRSLVVRRDASLGGFTFAARPDASGARSWPVLPDGPRGVDSAGRIYWSGTPFRVGPGVPINTFADSFPVLRLSQAARRVDTVAWLRRLNATSTGDAGSRSSEISSLYPYPATDQWAVLPNGAVVILRSPEYRIEWRLPDRPVVYGSASSARIPLTGWHQRAWRASRSGWMYPEVAPHF